MCSSRPGTGAIHLKVLCSRCSFMLDNHFLWGCIRFYVHLQIFFLRVPAQCLVHSLSLVLLLLAGQLRGKREIICWLSIVCSYYFSSLCDLSKLHIEVSLTWVRILVLFWYWSLVAPGEVLVLQLRYHVTRVGF
jgi:hypothetical protein